MTQTCTHKENSSRTKCAPVSFTKMQALGNDFIIIAESELAGSNRSGAQLARLLCDRHFGIGGDGLILAKPATNPDCKLGWAYFNSDGSLSDMCGNGLRCLALWACLEQQMSMPARFFIETAVGPVSVQVESEFAITTEIGLPRLTPAAIPVAGFAETEVIARPLNIDGQILTVTCVNMGNPHCVIFDSGFTDEQAMPLAIKIQQSSQFPQGVNVEFVQTAGRQKARAFVLERGCGPTLACASGAAAVLVAGVLENRLERSAVIELPGGQLIIDWAHTDAPVRISGPATLVFRGQFDLLPSLSRTAS